MVKTYPSRFKITIDSIDVTSYLYEGNTYRTKNQPVKTATLKFKRTLSNVLTTDNTLISKDVVITRGFLTSTERTIFRGEVVNFKPIGSVIEINCSDKLYAMVRREYNYSYDINTDTQAGVGSEIAKDLITQAELSYSSTSIVDTGTTNVFNRYPVKGKIIDTMKKLSSIYYYQFFYNDEDDYVYFIPAGYTPTTTILTTGTEIVNRIQWQNTSEDMRNSITIIGGQQLDWAEETAAGPVTEYELLTEPVDTDVSENGTKLQRGVNSSDPKDFYVSGRTLYFTTSQTNLVMAYSYNVPVKVLNTDYTSVANYKQRDETFYNENLTDSDDATIQSENYLDGTSDVLVGTDISVISNNDLQVGQQIRVVDNINNRTEDVIVQAIRMFFPFKPDQVNVGDVPATSTDMFMNIMVNIENLQRQLSSQTDIDVTIIGIPETIVVSGYTKTENATADTDVLYWDSDTQGLWANDAGSIGYNWGDDTEETYTTDSLIPVNNTIYEDFYSDEFKDATSTATWSNTGSCTFTSGQIALSKYYIKDTDRTISSITFEATYTGTLTFQISADGINWQTITNGPVTITNTGNYLYWKATESAATTATLTSIYIYIN